MCIRDSLLVLTCILKAVDTHADLLRESAADVGNDHRRGANEAPPAILSVYLGEQLEDVLSQLISTGDVYKRQSQYIVNRRTAVGRAAERLAQTCKDTDSG